MRQGRILHPHASGSSPRLDLGLREGPYTPDTYKPVGSPEAAEVIARIRGMRRDKHWMAQYKYRPSAQEGTKP